MCSSILLVSKVAIIINRDGWGHWYYVAKDEILGLTQNQLLQKHLLGIFSLIKNKGYGIKND